MDFTANQLDLYEFDLDPFKDKYTYETVMEFAERAEDSINQILTEDVDPNKPGFINRIWSMIKAIGAWIVKGLTILKKLG